MRRTLPIGNRIRWLIVLGIFGPTNQARGEDAGDLLALVKAGHQSAKEAIHTLSCTATLDEKAPSFERTSTAKYWRSMDVARIQQETPTGTSDWFYLYKISEVRAVVRNRPGTGQPRWLTARRTINNGPAALDVWRLMFMEFDLFIQFAKGAPRVKREKVDGRDCVRVTMDIFTETEMTYWFDAGRNYLVWKSASINKNDRSESENLEFIEPQPGVFFPTNRVSRTYRGGEERNHSFAVLSDVRINEPLAKNALQIPVIPSGTTCSDWIKKQRYPIDENWQPIPGGQVEPLAYTPLPSPSPSSGEGTRFTAQSKTEPKSWTRWIAWGSLIILVLAGAAWVYRRYRVRSLERV